MNAVVSEIPEWPSVAMLALDAALHLVCLPLLAVLLAMLVRVASRGLADIRLKTTAWTTLAVMTLVFLLNTSPDGVLGFYAYAAISLISAILIKRVFWVEIDHAIIASFVFVFLSVSLLDYSRRGLDALIPERVSITEALADHMDARTRASTGDYEFPPSQRFMPALLRMLDDPDPEAGIIADLMAPFRTLTKAKAKIADIDKVARDQASIVNMLSGAGTNVGDRASEMKALEQSLAADVANGTLRPSSAGGEAGAPRSGFEATAGYVPPTALPTAEEALAGSPPAPTGAAPPARRVAAPPAPPAPAGRRTTFAESLMSGLIRTWARLTGRPLPETEAPVPAQALATRTPKPRAANTNAAAFVGTAVVPAPTPADVSPAPVTTGVTAMAASTLPSGPTTDLQATVSATRSVTVGTVEVGTPPADVLPMDVTNAPAAEPPQTPPMIESAVIVTQAESVTYVRAPPDLKISGVVSRSDGLGFLTCNGKIVAVGGTVTSSAEGREITLKLETITNNQPRWSLVVDTGQDFIIPLGH